MPARKPMQEQRHMHTRSHQATYTVRYTHRHKQQQQQTTQTHTQTHTVYTPGAVVCPCNLSDGEVETGDLCSSLARYPGL